LGAAKKLGFRSGLEVKVAEQLKGSGVAVEYETTKIKYVVPESVHTYTPDFVLPNGIIVETKGRFVVADRKKHLLIQKQHPDKDIRFVFTNSNNKISKSSKTSYADWCRKNGFIFADKKVPDEWLK
jgi:sugar lactone lactonase YvrE